MDDPYAAAVWATPDEVLEKKGFHISCFIVMECHLLYPKCVISMAKRITQAYNNNNKGYNGVFEVVQG